MSTLPQKLSVYFDGSCEPRNPGGVASYGWIVRGEDAIELKSGKGVVCEGAEATNNVAEYAAIGFALRWLADEHWRGHLKIFGDSQLVVKQITGEWACRKPHLQKLLARCQELLQTVAEKYEVSWIPREQNHDADLLSVHAYEEHTGKPYPQWRR